MKIFFLSFMISLGIVASAFAADTNPYQQTQLVIKNNAPYPVLLTIDTIDGNFSIPTELKKPILLTVNQTYQNTVISLKKNNSLENFVSLNVAQLNNVHQNYLIFAETTSSENQEMSGDIFDGSGALFVKSDTNYCHDRNTAGYAYCQLTILDNH